MNWKSALALVLLNLTMFSVAAFDSDPMRNDGLMDHRMDIPDYLFSENELNDSLQNSSNAISHEDELSLPLRATPGSPGMDWSKTFGGANTEYGYNVVEANDGGYTLVGTTYSYGSGSQDIWLIKTDPAGNMLWNRTLGGSKDEYGVSIQETSDGGYVIPGVTYSYSSGSANGDLWLIKTDSAGNMLWNRTFGGEYDDLGHSVLETRDGDLVVAGSTNSYGMGGDVYLVKTDSAGNMLWNRTFGGAYLDFGNSVQETADGGYIITGYTYSYGSGEDDVWLIKTDSAGNELWNKTFGGSFSDSSYSVQDTGDGGYVIAGTTYSYGSGKSDIWLIRTDSSGSKLWEKTFGGMNHDVGLSVVVAGDGSYIITGSTDSYGSGNIDVWLIRTDLEGNKFWDRTYGGPSSDDIGYSVQETSDRGYIISGSTFSYGSGGSDIWLIKTEPSGRLYYPDFTDTVDANGWRSWLVVQNPSSSAARIFLNIRSRSGDLLFSGSATIPGYGVYAIRPRNLVGSDCSGSAIISSDQPIVGTCQISRNNNQMCMSYNALDQGSEALYYPDFTDTANPDSWRSWLVIQNPAAASANITLQIRSRSGDLIYSGGQSIPAHGASALRPKSLVGSDCTGSVTVTSDLPIMGTCQITRNNNLMCMSYTAFGASDWLPSV